MLDIYEPGSTVYLNDGISGTINKVSIFKSHVLYDISYWYNGVRTVVTLEGHEFNRAECTKMKVGFCG